MAVLLVFFIDELYQYMDDHTTTNGDLLLFCDFNFHFKDETNADKTKCNDFLYSLNLQLHIQDITHNHGHMWIWSSQ